MAVEGTVEDGVGGRQRASSTSNCAANVIRNWWTIAPFGRLVWPSIPGHVVLVLLQLQLLKRERKMVSALSLFCSCERLLQNVIQPLAPRRQVRDTDR